MAFRPRIVQQQAQRTFVYRPRGVAEVKERLSRRTGSFDGLFKNNTDLFKPKDGLNCVRILPPTWENPTHYSYDIAAHMYVGADQGSYLCLKQMLGTPCAMCDAADYARRAGDEQDYKDIRFKGRRVLWLLDRNAEDPRLPRAHSWAERTDQEILALTYSDRRGNEVLQVDDPDNGFDLLFRKDGKGDKTRYSSWNFERATSPIDDDINQQNAILDAITARPIDECLQYYDNDYLEKVITGQVARIGPEDDPTQDLRGGVRASAPTGRVRINGGAPPAQAPRPAPRQLPRAMQPVARTVTAPARMVAAPTARARILAAPAAPAPVRRIVRRLPDDDIPF